MRQARTLCTSIMHIVHAESIYNVSFIVSWRDACLPDGRQRCYSVVKDTEMHLEHRRLARPADEQRQRGNDQAEGKAVCVCHGLSLGRVCDAHKTAFGYTRVC